MIGRDIPLSRSKCWMYVGTKWAVKKPINVEFIGFLASLAGFEPTTYRLGELQLRMAHKARRRLDKTQKASNLGKNRHCLLCSFKSL